MICVGYYYGKIHYLTREHHGKFHAKTRYRTNCERRHAKMGDGFYSSRTEKKDKKKTQFQLSLWVAIYNDHSSRFKSPVNAS